MRSKLLFCSAIGGHRNTGRVRPSVIVWNGESNKTLHSRRIKLASSGFVTQLGFTGLALRKTIRILGVSLALVMLLVFATGVVSDWHHDSFTNGARCPYCHLGHQIPVGPETALCVAVLNPVATVILQEDFVPATGPVFSQIAPRAPPTA
jgi:hypothetical protein